MSHYIPQHLDYPELTELSDKLLAIIKTVPIHEMFLLISKGKAAYHFDHEEHPVYFLIGYTKENRFLKKTLKLDEDVNESLKWAIIEFRNRMKYKI